MIFRFLSKKNFRSWVTGFFFYKGSDSASWKNFEKSSEKIGKSGGLIPRPLESPDRALLLA